MSCEVADDAVSPAVRAERMLDLWSRLAMRHVALGAACACGAGGIALRLEDFELDIVGYLEDAGARSEAASAAAWFAGRPPAGGERPLRDLLEAIGAGDAMPPEVADWLVGRVERTLHSYAELHGAA